MFIRIEDISIEYRSRYFIWEWNVDIENSVEYLNNINEIDLVICELDEVVSDCLVILESFYFLVDDRKIIMDIVIIIGGCFEEDIIVIDEKICFFNEVNIVLIKIDFI